MTVRLPAPLSARSINRTCVPAAIPMQRRQLSGLNLESAIKDIEARWHLLPEAERGAIADALAEKHKGDWKKMSLNEKRACTYWHLSPLAYDVSQPFYSSILDELRPARRPESLRSRLLVQSGYPLSNYRSRVRGSRDLHAGHM